jgi:hypothetical protein
MSLLHQIALIFISSFVFNAQIHAEQNKNVKDNLKVISIYQIEDESSAGFDFFTSQKTHKCGGKLSNRYRSYSDHPDVNERKFQLVLAALNYQYNLSLELQGCEGRTMLVNYIGISH